MRFNSTAQLTCDRGAGPLQATDAAELWPCPETSDPIVELAAPRARQDFRAYPLPFNWAENRTFNSQARQDPDRDSRSHDRKIQTSPSQLHLCGNCHLTPLSIPSFRLRRPCWPGALHDAPIDSGPRFCGRACGSHDRNAAVSRCIPPHPRRGLRQCRAPGCLRRSWGSWIG